MKTTFWYSTQNGGDGSAYPLFFTTEELARWDENNPKYDEGFCESVSCIEIESEGPVTMAKALDATAYYQRRFGGAYNLEWASDGEKKLRETFVQEFLGGVTPPVEGS
jgi:hypothetical protein